MKFEEIKSIIMNLIIKPSSSIASIQQNFQAQFPYLKIEFYKVKHETGEASAKENTLSGALILEDVFPKLKEGIITLTPSLKVLELEQLFAKNFGISVQVFHKSGNVWLQTTRTDHWTLLEQNKHAEEKEHPLPDTFIDAMDRQELE
jgi:hypothetical protein